MEKSCEEIRAEAEGLLAFLKKSPTCYHAVAAAEELLPGFPRLEEGEKWQLVPGGRYYVTRNRSSLIAFILPTGRLEAWQLTASHSDSPTFKVKENAEVTVRGKYVQLDTERYGGLILGSWVDRPLSVAGRVMVRDGAGLHSRLVCVDRDLCVIPNVAIHMNRQINEGYKYQPHIDLYPLWGGGDAAGSFRRVIAETAGVAEDAICGTDLFLYSRTPGAVWGPQGEFLSAGRLDDLECVYAALRAIAASESAEHHANVACVFDNEEVGSTTKQGANSTFLEDVLRRISLGCGLDAEEHLAALAGSFMLSADNAHAMHPNHPEFSDPNNCAFMNEGVVVKYNASQKYTTDAVSRAVFGEICAAAGVPVQHYANRSDMAGGGTLGNISGTHVSINTVDIGLAQLAMHSCYETAGTRDLGWMIDAMRAFHARPVRRLRDGEYSL